MDLEPLLLIWKNSPVLKPTFGMGTAHRSLAPLMPVLVLSWSPYCHGQRHCIGLAWGGVQHVLTTQNSRALQFYWGALHRGPLAVLVFSLPLSTGKRRLFFYSYSQNQHRQTLGTGGTFLKDARPYLPSTSYSERMLPGPPFCTVQVSSGHSSSKSTSSPLGLQHFDNTKPVIARLIIRNPMF